MQITRKCPSTGNLKTIDIHVNLDQVRAWENGRETKDAMPNVPYVYRRSS